MKAWGDIRSEAAWAGACRAAIDAGRAPRPPAGADTERYGRCRMCGERRPLYQRRGGRAACAPCLGREARDADG